MWFGYALAGALFKSLSAYNRKKVSHLSSTVFAWVQYCLALILLLPFIVLFKLPVFDLFVEHPFILLGITITTLAGTLMNVKALSKDELSFVAPLNGIIPVVGMILGLVFLQEIPTILGIIGVVAIFTGTYIMALETGRVNWYDPIIRLSSSKAAQLSVGVAISYALSTIFVKAALNEGYDPLTVLYSLSILGFCILSYIFFTVKRREIVPAVKNHPKDLFASSVSSLLGAYLHNVAVSMTLVSYALAVRRFDTIFSVLLGWRYLKESNIRNKLIGAVVVVVGSAMIVIFT